MHRSCRVWQVGSQQAPLASSNPLPLLRLQRNRRACYNFAGLGIEDPHYLSMIPIVKRTRLRPPVQLFQTLSHLNSVLFTSLAMFTVGMVDSQEGQQGASQVHDPPRRIRSFASRVLRPRRELLFGEAGRIMPQDEGVVSIKFGLHLDARRSQEPQRHYTH